MTTEIYSLSEIVPAGEALTAIIGYDAEHAVFEGHFPGNPIVPGVCTINMLTDIVRLQLGAGYELQGAASVKFLQLIRPGDRPMLRMSWKPAETGMQVQAILEIEGRVAMRFAGIYEDYPKR